MDNGIKDALIAIGATAEILGVFLRELIRNGFSRGEAIDLSKEYLNTMLTNKNNQQQEDD